MPKITELYAFVAIDTGPDDEGIMAMHDTSFPGANGLLPLVGADMARVDSIRPIAEEIAAAAGVEYRILKFKLVGEIPK